jgi:hypothetical protein
MSPATSWTEKHADLIEAETGMRPFAKPLRIALDVPWHPPEACPRFPASGSESPPAYVPCEIERINAFMLHREDSDSPDVVEVVAPVDLRETLALVDGDHLQVTVNRGDASNVVAGRRFIVFTALAILILLFGAIFGIVAVLTSVGVAAVVLLVGALAVIAVLWWARFRRQAAMFPFSIPLRWPIWRD